MDLLPILKWILSLKFGWVILIVAGVLIGGSLIKNIISGSFSVGKLASGFNPFTGSVQGKLIYYGLILLLAFGLYHQLTRSTYDTDYNTNYRNNVNQNRDVYLDQRVGDVCQEKCAIAIQPFGWTLLKVGCTQSCAPSITQRTKVDNATITVPIIEIPKKTKWYMKPFKFIGNIFKKKETK
jgi:hypothetical protein